MKTPTKRFQLVIYGYAVLITLLTVALMIFVKSEKSQQDKSIEQNIRYVRRSLEVKYEDGQIIRKLKKPVKNSKEWRTTYQYYISVWKEKDQLEVIYQIDEEIFNHVKIGEHYDPDAEFDDDDVNE